MTHLPSFRQLRFLVALADELHFGRAAARCNVTQSTLSAGLKELESTLGIVVAERSKRHVFLTSIGERLAERARRLLADAEAMVEMAAAEGRPLSGLLRLGAIPTIGPFLLPKAMPALRQRFPDLKLILREELTDRLLDGLTSGKLDGALLALPFAIGDLEYAELFDDGYQLACGLRHPLANRDKITEEDLQGRTVLLLEKGHCLQEHALSAFSPPAFHAEREFAATSLNTLISMVSEGLGVTLLPQIAVDAHVAQGHDVALAPIEGVLPRKVILAWRKESPRSEELRTLAELFRSAYRQGDA
ncbi:MAG: hydrogen peroxide-inducible genes activator [Neomegalonema sp.]|nr:hydrogen peroxide-inducible genes activator [Neomegalonema sp.]